MKTRHYLLIASGWLVAIALGLYIAANHQSKSPPETAAAERAAQQSESGRRPAQWMEVYVRPHPPDFLEGRWIRFTRYSRVSDGGRDSVVFYGVSSAQPLARVAADSVDWPGVRRHAP